jgi:hypothetical protein
MSDIEQQLRTALQDQRWALPAPADPAAWAKAGRSLPAPRRGARWRGSAAIAAAALAAVGAVLVPTVLQPAGQSDALAWRELPAPPLSPRTGAIAAWTGTEAVFLGGDPTAPCPPNASCTEPPPDQRDGAAYNPTTGRWRETSPAPVRLPTHDRPPVVGDRVYIRTDEAVAVYDASSDAWSTLPPPPGPADGFWSLRRVGDTVAAIRQQQREQYAADQLYDPAAGRWTPLPRDPLVPSAARHLIDTPHGVVLVGNPDVPNPGAGANPSLARAAVLDLKTMTWRRLPDSEQLGATGFTWTGSRLVDPRLGRSDGAAAEDISDYGRYYDNGGTLDPQTGTWGRLPNAPEELTGGWPVYAIDGPRIATDGYLYDDAAERWTRTPEPEGGPESPGSAVWAGDNLIVFGGRERDDYTIEALTNAAYLLSVR